MTAAASEAALRGDVDRMLGRLVEPALADLAAQLRSVPTLSAAERSVVHAATATALTDAVWRRVSRVAVLELNAARVTGELAATDPAERWREWVERLAAPGGWEAVARPYPPLLPGIRRIVDHRCAAALRLARRFGADRPRLAELLAGAAGELRELTFGAGDTHHGGQTVTGLACDAGRLVYKPRSLRVDAALAELLGWLLAGEPAATRIRVPAVLTRQDRRGEYGWAAQVPHRHCRDESELRAFYRGLGHWLAVMRLLGGSDLHHENVVASGPVPVVVDCETLFTPHASAGPSGYGAATDLAVDRIGGSLLRTGLLPGRGATLGWRGVDLSGVGFLPGQQPTVPLPTLVDHGTDHPRVVAVPVPVTRGHNLPSPEPDLSQHWERVVDGFVELTDRLHQHDRAGELAPRLAGFADCPVRVVVRDTAAYQELARMLWHPGSLHEPAPARRRAAELLARHAGNRPAAPADPAVIDAEIDALLAGDVPVFSTTPGTGVLAGPGGTRWGPARNLLADALDRWRGTEPVTERRVVRAALVGAYLNDGASIRRDRLPAPRARTGDLDRRRRVLAAAVMRRVQQAAIRAGDQTATWVAPVLDPTGWAVRPFGPDLYGGTTGVAVTIAGYQREVARGRADAVPGLAELLPAVLRTLRLTDEQEERARAASAGAGIRHRPEPPGGYLGLGSRVWGWLLLADLGAVPAAEAVRRAVALAGRLPEAIEADPVSELMAGAAGAVVPLLRLAERTGDDRWRELARETGRRLGDRAQHTDAGAGWPSESFPDGIGGFSHGVTGIGWALARLAAATGDAAPRRLADAAFAREESFYDQQRGGWRDARPWLSAEAQYGAAWCHGSVGIGIAAADLLSYAGGDRWRELLARAVAASWPAGLDWNHTLCHGDLGVWELLHRARSAGVDHPAGQPPAAVAARVLSSLEEHGPVTGLARDVFSAGLVAGHGGLAYQLLRMHPECDLPSVLLPDSGPG